MDNFMDDIREDFSKQAEQHNNESYTWEAKIDEIYKRADNNFQDGVNYADSLRLNDKTLDKLKISELLTIVGEIYYDNDSIDLALERFHINEKLTSDTPRNKVNKAGCYIKKGDFDKALTLLNQAAETNYDFYWYIGNFYEIKGEPEKAISQYAYVYKRDTIVYADYNKRIQELRKNPDQLMTELCYKDRRKRTLILLKGVN